MGMTINVTAKPAASIFRVGSLLTRIQQIPPTLHEVSGGRAVAGTVTEGFGVCTPAGTRYLYFSAPLHTGSGAHTFSYKG